MDYQLLLLTIAVSFILAVIAAPLIIPLLHGLSWDSRFVTTGPRPI